MMDVEMNRFSPREAPMNGEQRMTFDFSQIREGGVVTGAALALWALVSAGGAGPLGQILTVVGTGLMGIITMLAKHLLEKRSREERRELRRLREENEIQDQTLRMQADQINRLSIRVARLSGADTGDA